MADNSIIAWTNSTFNPWMGCVKISDGCKHCYADTLVTNRMGLKLWGPPSTTTRKVTGATIWAKPHKWNRDAAAADEETFVFCASLCDVFEDHPVADATRPRLWDVIRATPHLTWQILTKRPERIAEHLPADWGEGWPHVWLGTSIEDMRVVHRAEHLCRVPAVVRFVSYEPALGPLDLSRWFGFRGSDARDSETRECCLQCGYQWGADNRRDGEDLASGSSEGQSVGGRIEADPLPPAASGASDSARVSADSRDDSRQEIHSARTSAGVSPRARGDSTGHDRESREWGSLGQPTGQPHADDRLSAADAPDHTGQLQSARRAESPQQAHGCPACGGQTTALRRGITFLDRDGIWRELPSHLQNRSADPLISWVVYGGESGPGYRAHDLAWPRVMRDRCAAEGVAFFFKQSAAPRTEMGIRLDGELIRLWPTPRTVQHPSFPDYRPASIRRTPPDKDYSPRYSTTPQAEPPALGAGIAEGLLL